MPIRRIFVEGKNSVIKQKEKSVFPRVKTTKKEVCST
jgi:hypothetical protein